MIYTGGERTRGTRCDRGQGHVVRHRRAREGVAADGVAGAARRQTVSEATRKRIEAVAQLLGYKVDRAASSLRSGHSNTLALLFFEDPLPDGSFINPFFLSMLGSILMTCAQRNTTC